MAAPLSKLLVPVDVGTVTEQCLQTLQTQAIPLEHTDAYMCLTPDIIYTNTPTAPQGQFGLLSSPQTFAVRCAWWKPSAASCAVASGGMCEEARKPRSTTGFKALFVGCGTKELRGFPASSAPLWLPSDGGWWPWVSADCHTSEPTSCFKPASNLQRLASSKPLAPNLQRLASSKPLAPNLQRLASS